MKVYVINFQEVKNHSCVNALIRSLLEAFDELDDDCIFLTSHIDKPYKPNVRGHGKFFFSLYRLSGRILSMLNLPAYIRRTLQERLVDFAHYLILRKEKEPYVLITTQYAPYSVKLASKRNNKTILLAGNLNDELYYDVVTKEKKRLNLKFEDIYSSKFRISVFRSMMTKVDEVWCSSPLCVKSFIPKTTKLLPISLDIKEIVYQKRNKIDESSLTLGYIGFTSLLKGVHLLVEAISRSKYCSSIKLELCGNIDPNIKPLLDNPKVNIIFKGFIPESEKLDVIKNFDCLVVPSLYDAGPTTIAEGISCNIPVLVSSGCGYSDTIKEVEGCFVFETQNVHDLENKIDYIFENKKSILMGLSNAKITKFENKSYKDSIINAIKEL